METQEMARHAQQVFDDHLTLRLEGALEEDLTRNYAEDVVLLCETGVMKGFDGVRWSANRLKQRFPNQPYEYLSRFVEGEYAFLKWSAGTRSKDFTIGADSFLIRGGKIVMQSVYYA